MAKHGTSHGAVFIQLMFPIAQTQPLKYVIFGGLFMFSAFSQAQPGMAH